METNYSPFVLLYSPEMVSVARSIAEELHNLGSPIPCYEIGYKVFANGEIKAKIPHTIRGQHVFFLQDLQHPDPNIQMMKLLIANDAILRASASGITLIVPHIPYQRQDRKDEPRVPITARLIFDLIESNPIVRGIITMDLHVEQAQGFSRLPVDNLPGRKLFATYIRDTFGGDLSNLVIAAPDFGSLVRNERLANELGPDIPITILQKRHIDSGETVVVSVFGADVKDRDIVIFDDILDTGGTSVNTMVALKKLLPRSIRLVVTHGIFSKGEEKFRAAKVTVATTDSIPRTDEYYHNNPWLTRISIAPYFAPAIHEAMQMGGSISQLEIK